MQKPSLEDFLSRIAEICTKDTSADPAGWTPENPLWGHCAMVTLLLQEIYGGEVLRASLLHIPSLAHIRSHYANALPALSLVDGTAGQFGAEYPKEMTFAHSSRAHILQSPDTVARYQVFRKRYSTLVLRISLRKSLQEHKDKPPVPRRKR